MNIQDLGAIGEFVSALVVLVSLVYIAVQTRQARAAAEETAKFASLQATHSIIDLYIEARETLLEHQETISKANEGEPLSGSERLAVSLVFHDLFYAAAYSHRSAASDGSFHQVNGDVEYLTGFLEQNPCAVSEWHRMKASVARMDPGFVQGVEDELGSNE